MLDLRIVNPSRDARARSEEGRGLVFYGFEHGGRGPSQDHLATTPPFDVPLHMPRAADQAFDGIGGHQRLTEAIREPEREHGVRFVEPFAHTGRGTRIAVLQASRRIVQHASSDGDVGLFMRAHDDRADPRALALRQVVHDVSELVPTSGPIPEAQRVFAARVVVAERDDVAALERL